MGSLRFLSPLFLIVTMGFAISVTHADESAIQPENFRRFSLTISPIHLLMPVLELTGEYMVSRHLGLAVVGGVGQISVDGTNSFGETQKVKFDVLETGGQIRYYPFRPAPHGLQLGGETLWLHVSGSPDVNVTGTGAGLALGPFVGYKYTSSFGLTFDTQLGYEFLVVNAEAHDNQGNSGTGSGSKNIVLLNLNVGWSF